MVKLNSTMVGEAIEGAENADAMDAGIARAQLFAELLRAAETGTFDPGAELVELVREHKTGTLEHLEYEHRGLNKLRAGDMGQCGVGMTPLETERAVLNSTDSCLDEVAACDRILGAVEGGS